jgi:hypothetical protein
MLPPDAEPVIAVIILVRELPRSKSREGPFNQRPASLDLGFGEEHQVTLGNHFSLECAYVYLDLWTGVDVRFSDISSGKRLDEVQDESSSASPRGSPPTRSVDSTADGSDRAVASRRPSTFILSPAGSR